MRFPNTFIRLLVVLAIGFGLGASSIKAEVSQKEADKREKSLETAENTTDSIKILLDVYNLSDKPQRIRVRKQLLTLASRSESKEVIGEVVKELSATNDDATDLNRLIEISYSIMPADSQGHLYTALQMEQAQSEAPQVVDSQLKKQIADYRRQGVAFSGDVYKEIQNIYRTMVYLGATSQGPMYFENLKRLEGLVESLPNEDFAIKNAFYTTAAIYYTRMRDYKAAIENDRKLIAQLDIMKKLMEEQGKNSHELDYYYYLSNRRMLRNFRGLSPQEVEEVYAKCVELSEIDPRSKESFGTGGLTNSYYYFATKQYDKAIPELKKALSNPDIGDNRRQELLRMLGSSYYRTGGDEKEELKTLREYTRLSLADREKRRQDLYRELELRNSVNGMIADELQQNEKQIEDNRVMRKTSITLVYVLALILIFLCQGYLRLRHKVKILEQKNNKLRQNIEYIFDDGVPKGSTDLHRKKNRLKG